MMPWSKGGARRCARSSDGNKYSQIRELHCAVQGDKLRVKVGSSLEGTKRGKNEIDLDREKIVPFRFVMDGWFAMLGGRAEHSS
jgi:hypothetical protein